MKTHEKVLPFEDQAFFFILNLPQWPSWLMLPCNFRFFSRIGILQNFFGLVGSGNFRWRKLSGKSQTCKANSRVCGYKLPDIRRLRQQRDRCWPLLGHEINFFVCAKSQTNIRSRETGRQEYLQGLSLPFLKTFAAVFPDSTDCLWVSEDTFTKEMIYTLSQ